MCIAIGIGKDSERGLEGSKPLPVFNSTNLSVPTREGMKLSINSTAVAATSYLDRRGNLVLIMGCSFFLEALSVALFRFERMLRGRWNAEGTRVEQSLETVDHQESCDR